MTPRAKRVTAAAAAVVCAAGLAALVWKPALRLWRQLAKLPDENGMYRVEDGLFQYLGELDTASVDKFAQKLNKLQDDLFTDANRVFWAVVPDKSWYASDSGYPVLDHAALIERLSPQLPDMAAVPLEDTLDLASYYRTDRHWRQEKLQPVTDALGEAMDFSVDWESFTTNEYEGFLGDYSRRLSAEPETLYWLTSPATDAATVENMQEPDQTAVYDTARLETDVPYDLFLSGATPFEVIRNPNAPDRELVIFRDSYSSSLAPLLCSEYRTITLIDLRYMFSRLLPEYITFTDQDVLFLYSDWVVNTSAMLR